MKTLLAVITGATAAIAIAATGALAKEPHEVRITGPGMSGEASFEMNLLTGHEAAPLLGDSIDTEWVGKPEGLPDDEGYLVEIWGHEGETETEFLFTTVTYYPAADGRPAVLRTEQNAYAAVGTKLETVLDSSIAAATPDDSDASPLVWYIAPSLALGLVLAGSGFVGRRFLLRRNIDT